MIGDRWSARRHRDQRRRSRRQIYPALQQERQGAVFGRMDHQARGGGSGDVIQTTPLCQDRPAGPCDGVERGLGTHPRASPSHRNEAEVVRWWPVGYHPEQQRRRGMFIQIQELKLTSWWCFPTATATNLNGRLSILYLFIKKIKISCV